jgi:acyl-CoA thioesterase-1
MLKWHQRNGQLTFLLVFTGALWLSACQNTPARPAPGQQPPAATPGGIGNKTIVFFGNSLTAGYGVNLAQAFPALIQGRIDSLNLPYKVVNAGLSGETSAGGKGRIGWILRQPVDIFVLELGGNDGLRGIPLSATSTNLQAIIDSVKKKYPSARLLLAGMQIPPSMGNTYASQFKQVFRDLAEKNKMRLIPFLLQGVGGIPELNQQDGIHPTAEGHKIVAENVWQELKDML